jgi:hypothetical protein
MGDRPSSKSTVNSIFDFLDGFFDTVKPAGQGRSLAQARRAATFRAGLGEKPRSVADQRKTARLDEAGRED